MVRALLLVDAPTWSTYGVWTANSWSEWFRCPHRSGLSDSWNSCLTLLTAEPVRYINNKTSLHPPWSLVFLFIFLIRASLFLNDHVCVNRLLVCWARMAWCALSIFTLASCFSMWVPTTMPSPQWHSVLTADMLWQSWIRAASISTVFRVSHSS